MKRYDKAILILLLLVFALGIIITARSAVNPYVSFAEVRNKDGQVQVKGLAVAGSLVKSEDGYSFLMEDDNGEIVRVLVDGSVPGNLFEAENIVVTGKFSGSDFSAAHVLVKCPSKYEADEHPEDIGKK